MTRVHPATSIDELERLRRADRRAHSDTMIDANSAAPRRLDATKKSSAFFRYPPRYVEGITTVSHQYHL